MLMLTFGMSGLRSLLRLIDALLHAPLSEQTVTLSRNLAHNSWIDLGLQLCSAAALMSWGLLALFLLRVHQPPHLETGGLTLRILNTNFLGDLGWGCLLAAIIGIPGLGLYLLSLHLGWTKHVIPADLNAVWWSIPVLVLWSFANAFAEEIVVVYWLCIRLRQLRLSPLIILVASAVLRGSYHLYQGVSAGFGNIAMGIVFVIFFYRTHRVRPLIIAHLLIDVTAFAGYYLLGSSLHQFGL